MEHVVGSCSKKLQCPTTSVECSESDQVGTLPGLCQSTVWKRHLHVGVKRERRTGNTVNASAFVFSNVAVWGDDEYLVPKPNKVADRRHRRVTTPSIFGRNVSDKESYAERNRGSRFPSCHFEAGCG